MRTFGETVRHVRRERGWSQAELAARLGTTALAIGSLERGQHAILSHERVCIIAETLGVSGDWLCFCAGLVPHHLRYLEANEGRVLRAWSAFRTAICEEYVDTARSTVAGQGGRLLQIGDGWQRLAVGAMPAAIAPETPAWALNKAVGLWYTAADTYLRAGEADPGCAERAAAAAASAIGHFDSLHERQVIMPEADDILTYDRAHLLRRLQSLRSP